MNIKKAREVLKSLGMTLEDRGHEYVIRDKNALKIMGLNGMHYTNDEMGRKQLEEAVVILWNGRDQL